MPKPSPSPFLPSPLLFPSPLHLNFFPYLVLGVLEFAGSVWDDCRPIIRALCWSHLESSQSTRKPAPASSSLRAFRPFVQSNLPLYLPNSIPVIRRAISVTTASATPTCLYMA
ncbi:hypothetical protein ACN42_g2829 [Penicillium freii]|uniref:Uncharacterized protein n=1 Tax=Penicillium freii TaxID=48697 RepID=A0A117NQL4_PENFR|nr:hypothetical protein ACN42_g2829 [Penicillium freii]